MKNAILSKQAEQRLKIESRAEFIHSMLANTTDVAARASFEADLVYLRSVYMSLMSDEEITRRVERLQKLRASINLRTTDNRRQYHQKQAVNRLAGLGA